MASPRWTPGALSHDLGGRSWRGDLDAAPHTAGGGQACHWPARWRPIAVVILDLPTPTRDEPRAVAGEISRTP